MDIQISCVIPTHNRVAFLHEALESIGRQTVKPHEVVVVSDVDDAEAEAACDAFAAESRISTTFMSYDSDHSGASESRNRGAGAASGTHIAFLDDDDTWEPEYLEHATKAARGTGAPLVVTWIQMFMGSKVKMGPSIPTGMTAAGAAVINPGATGSNMVIEAGVLRALEGFDPLLRMKNDTDFFYRFLKSGQRYAVVERRLVNQRKHDLGQLTGHSSARADHTARYFAKHRGDLALADRRHLRFVIHRIRSHTAPSAPQRLGHLALAVANISVKQYRADRLNRKDTDFYDVPAITELP
jgi:glycosyltransferase involved in cell wall biosynthesis